MRVLAPGRLEVLLSTLLAVVVVLVGWRTGNLQAGSRDLAICLAAACVVRWPVPASITLWLMLATYIVTPREWITFGEYAALIAVLSAGLAGDRRRRWIATLAYMSILTALQYRDYPGDVLVIYGALVWAALFAATWLIGDFVTALHQAQRDSAELQLAQQRLALSRDLHDTIMRTLTRLSLRIQLAESEQVETGRSVLHSVAEDLHRTATELRLTLALLRDGDPVQLSHGTSESLPELLRSVKSNLEKRGFSVNLTTDQPLDSLPEALTRVLAPVIGEVEANIERYAEPGSTCAITIKLDDATLVMVFVNQVTLISRHRTGRQLGLTGARERLSPIGGELSAHQEGWQWITQIVMPVPMMQHSD